MSPQRHATSGASATREHLGTTFTIAKAPPSRNTLRGSHHRTPPEREPLREPPTVRHAHGPVSPPPASADVQNRQDRVDVGVDRIRHFDLAYRKVRILQAMAGQHAYYSRTCRHTDR